MMRQAVPAAMEAHGGADPHRQPREDPRLELGVPEGGCEPVLEQSVPEGLNPVGRDPCWSSL